MSTLDCLIVIYILIVSVTFALSLANLLFDKESSFLVYTPMYIYEITNMNIVGSFITWLGIFILNPVFWIFMLCVVIFLGIANVFKWLFTVGRK